MKTIQRAYKDNPEFRESRLLSLFSDFASLKESNPEGYMANLNVWKQFLISVFESEDLLSFYYEEFQKKLIYRTNKNDFLPQGLYIVINDMINNDKSISVLLDLERTQDSKSGIIDTLKNVIFGKRLVDVRDKTTKQEVLISKEILEKKSNQIKSILLPIIKDDPINLIHLQAILKDKSVFVSDADLVLCLKFISKEPSEVCFEDGVIIQKQKAINLDMDTGDKNKLDDLRNIGDLNFAIYKLQKYNNEKLAEIKQLDSRIRESIKLKNLLSSKAQFRLKKILEQQVQKTSTSLENLHLLKIKVEDAHNNLLISKVWKENSNILKILNEKTETQNIDEVFDDLYNEIQNTNIISDKLSSKIVEPDYEDNEIETELAKLEANVNKEAEAAQENEVQVIEDKLKDLKIPEKKPTSKLNEEREKPREETRVPVNA